MFVCLCVILYSQLTPKICMQNTAQGSMFIVQSKSQHNTTIITEFKKTINQYSPRNINMESWCLKLKLHYDTMSK